MSQRKRSSETSKPIDYYAVLAVRRDAPLETIKEQYRMLAWEHHPDRGGDATKMAAYTEAWSVLRDKRKRKDYDALLALFSKECAQCKGVGQVVGRRGFSGGASKHECGVCGGTGRLE